MKVSAPLVAILLVFPTEAIADHMTIEFTFQGTKGCQTLFANPEIRLKQFPPGAKRVLLSLRGPEHEDMGGQEIPLPSNGVIPAAAIRTFAPCNPGFYTYKVVVKANDGEAIGTAEKQSLFPAE